MILKKGSKERDSQQAVTFESKSAFAVRRRAEGIVLEKGPP